MPEQLVLLALVAALLSSFGAAATPVLYSASPSVLPADCEAETLPVVLTASGLSSPPAGSVVTCHVRGGRNYGLMVAANNTAATWLDTPPGANDSILCHVPRAVVSFDGRLDLKLDGNESWSGPQASNASSLPPLRFRTFVEVALGRRPYLSNETDGAELLLRVDTASAAAFPPTANATHLHICYGFPTAGQPPRCHLAPLSSWRGDVAVSVPLRDLLAAVPQSLLPLQRLSSPQVLNVSINCTFVSGGGGGGGGGGGEPSFNADGDVSFRLATKYRLLMIAPVAALSSVGSFLAVNHRRRMLLKDGAPLLTQGFYVHSFTQYVRGLVSFQGCLDDLTGLAQQGVNHAQLYSMESLNATELPRAVAHLERIGIHFGYSLVGQVQHLLSSAAGGGNTTENWNSLLEGVAKVRGSSHLLGYYICDDCDKSSVFPLAGMAAIFQALKRLDPFHLTFGAPWTLPWAVNVWSENGGGQLSLDVVQVENYYAKPGDHLNDGADRLDMFFEPIINSPPMYLCNGPSANKELWPALIESTLGWMAVIEFGAVSQVRRREEKRREESG